ncbi:MAG: hypothetical protein U5K76_12720 [Woeseiaceae bacterium]|nr:hypothetical protein [Woeseiaceae bacterium]
MIDERFNNEHAIETYKSLMLYGAAGLKFVLVANGTAAISILTFVGHLTANGRTEIPDLRLPLGLLLLGVLVGGPGQLEPRILLSCACSTRQMDRVREFESATGSG